MGLAVIAGIAFGFLGFLPLRWGIKRSKGVTSTDTMGLLGQFLASIFLSLLVLLAPLVVCALVFRDVALGFALAELGVFLVTVLAYGFNQRKK